MKNKRNENKSPGHHKGMRKSIATWKKATRQLIISAWNITFRRRLIGHCDSRVQLFSQSNVRVQLEANKNVCVCVCVWEGRVRDMGNTRCINVCAYIYARICTHTWYDLMIARICYRVSRQWSTAANGG